MGRSRSADPNLQYRFLVEIEGIAGLGFSKVSGLDQESDVAEYDEGGFNATHKIPGKKKVGAVTFERGSTTDMDLYNWFKTALTSSKFRKTVTVVELDYDLTTVIKTHTLYEAWASKFSPGDFDAASSEVLIESIEVQCEDIVTE